MNFEPITSGEQNWSLQQHDGMWEVGVNCPHLGRLLIRVQPGERPVIELDSRYTVLAYTEYLSELSEAKDRGRPFNPDDFFTLTDDEYPAFHRDYIEPAFRRLHAVQHIFDLF